MVSQHGGGGASQLIRLSVRRHWRLPLVPATLARRVNAATIDLLVIVALAVGVPYAVPGTGLPPRIVRLVALFGAPLLLEPVLLRFWRRTVGQALLGLWVVPVGGEPPLGIVRLTLRYWLKLFLGSASLFYIYFTQQRQALHDKVFGTAVVYASRATTIPSSADLPTSHPDPTLPPAWRRFTAFLAWSIICQLALGLIVGMAIVAAEAIGNAPTNPNQSYPAVLDSALTVVGLLATLAMARLGASGRLPGARRSRGANGA